MFYKFTFFYDLNLNIIKNLKNKHIYLRLQELKTY